MCLTENIGTLGECVTGRAGIRLLQVAQCDAVADITFDPVTHEVTAISMDGLHPNPNFFEIYFEKDTGFFNQALTRNKNSINVAQSVQVIEPQNSMTLTRQIMALAECCCYVGVVTDENNNRWLVGVTYFPATDTFTVNDFRVNTADANSGSDSAADSNEIIVGMGANTGRLASALDPALVLA